MKPFEIDIRNNNKLKKWLAHIPTTYPFMIKVIATADTLKKCKQMAKRNGFETYFIERIVE